MTGLEAALLWSLFVMCWIVWRGVKAVRDERENVSSMDFLLARSRLHLREAEGALGAVQTELEFVEGERDDARQQLSDMTDERDELLARVQHDEATLETVFEDAEDAEEFLASRERAMRAMKQVLPDPQVNNGQPPRTAAEREQWAEENRS